MLRLLAAVAVVLAALALPATSVAAPKPGVFAGTLGVKVPNGGHAAVRAIEVAGGTVVASRDVGRSGAFTLSLPAGAYIVRGVVMPKRGTPVTKGVAVSLKAGQRRTRSKITAKRRARGARARAAFTTERGNVRLGSVAIGIYEFSGPPASTDLGAWATGFDDLLINDVMEMAATKCKGHVTVREVARMSELLREFELGKSPYADKSTFPQRDLIVLDVAIRGRITRSADGTPRAAITITNDRTGAALGEVEGSLGPDVYAGEEKLAGELVDKLCKLSETFEVTLDVAGEGRFATHSATGTMHSVLLARRGGEEWTATGTLQWGSVSFTSKTQCAYIDPVVPLAGWSVKIADTGGGLVLTWSTAANDSTTASVDCPPGGPGDDDPPPIPGQPGPALVNTGPQTLELPYTGGALPVSGVVQDGGDGFFNTGTITVKPLGITAPG